MNQTQVNNFLRCLIQIDDLNYLALHEHAAAINGSSIGSNAAAGSGNINYTGVSHLLGVVRSDDDHDHDHDHDHEGEEGEAGGSILVAKVTAMLVLCVASAICGSVPFLLNRCFRWTETNTNARSATVVKCLLYFGGGVLLCTTFLHLLPEVQETVEALQTCGSLPELNFELAEMLMCAGFLLMYLLEEVIHSFIHRHKRMLERDAGAGAAFERGHSVRHSYLVKGTIKQLSECEDEGADGCVVADADNSPTAPTAPSAPTGLLPLTVQDLLAQDGRDPKYMQQPNANGSNLAEVRTSNGAAVPHTHQHEYEKHHHPSVHSNNHYHSHAHNGFTGHSHTHLPTSTDADDMIASSLRGFLIVLALSLHELFEGMAIGLETSAGAVWFMFGAVSAHKLVLAFCVGVELIVARTRIALSIVYVLTFAVVSPIGIGIGILISNSGNSTAPGIPSAILQGLACGTLLYVVFFEILSKNHSGLFAYLSLFVGFLVMFGLQRLTADGHGHSHGQCAIESASTDAAKSLLYHSHQHAHSHDHAHGHSHDHHDHDHDHDHDHHHDHDNQDNSFAQQLQLLREASQRLFQQESEKKSL